MNPVSGVVFNIQRCSLHDGPGIRTTVFLKGCPLRCFWCQNPESQSGGPEILLDSRKCTLCGACHRACRNGAVRLEEGKPVFNRAECRGCGRCVPSCPNEARTISGKEMTVEEVLQEVLKDLKFYKKSGGGVTLSGGEPLAQPRFAGELFRRCKRQDLHTTLDTCGYAPWSSIKGLLEYVDLVLFDIKHPDAAKHAAATGRDNRLILENAKRIAKRKPMRVRIPLIPGFNDSAETVGEIVRFAKDELGCRDIDLLPYNRLGEIKYDFLDKACPAMYSQTDDHLRVLEALIGGRSAAAD
ncbi:MAG: glycyl-radical enzyme activating protein [Proteobacteria bacterium]|nr:glycyl-radical enzyme activating protein [Pseudomonadota bacterium]